MILFRHLPLLLMQRAHFVRHHHERVDGRGYPDSLIGTGLSDGVKILMIADAFDAMTTDRPYRRKLPLMEALREVKNSLETHFDGNISNVLKTTFCVCYRRGFSVPHGILLRFSRRHLYFYF